jgi:AraC family transcriptional regulator of adaptative response/methylated-DNA-[protein]-cysteine methyltransferase
MKSPHTFSSNSRRWSAVVGRDSRADGVFCYGVCTTGIYCRPSCPARRPLRQHVVFFAHAAQASHAGFRPCKRCAPDGVSPTERRRLSIAAACRRIRQATEPPSLASLASAAGLSRHHFHRVFLSVTGVTPRAYGEAHRRTRTHATLGRASTVTEAIYEAGYGSSTRFYAAARDTLGMPPATFRSGGAGASIRFAVGQCDLGAILVAATSDGVCAISIGDDAEALVRELQDRFPRAALAGGDPAFNRWMASVVGFVQAPRRGLDLPLDVRGTVFQQRVWQALRDVPPGATTTYTELARRLRMPRAQRAVARACAANPVALAIPCHRVIRLDGDPAGYRWGVERKRALLARESAGTEDTEARSTEL